METNGRDMVETLIRLAFASAKKKEQDKEEGALPTGGSGREEADGRD